MGKIRKGEIEPKHKSEIKKMPDAQVKMLTYKIAFPTNDGEFINPHFGHSKYFLIVEIEGKNIISREKRSNDSHQGMTMKEHESEHHHEHNNDPQHQIQQEQAHNRIFDLLHDVDILIAGNMGPGIRDQLIKNGFTVIKTNISKIDDALSAYLKGALKI